MLALLIFAALGAIFRPEATDASLAVAIRLALPRIVSLVATLGWMGSPARG